MGDVDKAENLFRSGCACSQAVLGTYGPRFGLKEDEAMRVSAGFAGGMRMAETALAATLVIGCPCAGPTCSAVTRFAVAALGGGLLSLAAA